MMIIIIIIIIIICIDGVAVTLADQGSLQEKKASPPLSLSLFPPKGVALTHGTA